jgi:hypothetical protein
LVVGCWVDKAVSQFLLGDLPPEVWKRTVDYLVFFDDDEYVCSKREGRRALSRASRVCRELSSTLRSLLFKELTLQDLSDISLLRSIIRSTVSMWLAPHIQAIWLSEYKGRMLSAVALLSSLPSVRNLCIHPDKTSTLLLELRPQLSHLYSLRYLKLKGIIFPSFSALLRLIGAILSLEELDLDSVDWMTACEPGQLPDCKAGFCNIKKVNCEGFSESHDCWPIAWIVTAAATGYSYRRSAVIARDPNPEIPPSNIDILVRTTKMVRTRLGILGDRGVGFE